MQPNHPSDRELAQQLKEGDQQAFKILFDRYASDLYAEACRRTGCPHDARDLVQDCFLDIFLQRDLLVFELSLAPLLFTILRNKTFNHFKKNIRQQKFKAVLQHFEAATTANGTDHSDPLAVKHLEDIIRSEVEGMPPRMKVIYRLSKQEGYSPGQVAELLTLSRQTVKNQLSAALKRIRDGLDACGFIQLWFVNIHLIYALGTMDFGS